MRKEGVVWGLDLDKFKEIISTSDNFSEVSRKLGFPRSGRNTETIKARIAEEGITIDHFYHRSEYSPVRPLEEILIQDSDYTHTSNLKKRLLSAGLLEEKCSICNMPNTWLGKKLVLILDHINGITNDNRISNLRLVCPNCNSQLPTYCGRNKKGAKERVTVRAPYSFEKTLAHKYGYQGTELEREKLYTEEQKKRFTYFQEAVSVLDEKYKLP